METRDAPATAARPSGASLTRAAGVLAVAGASYFVAAVVLLHFLRPDVDPVARVTSEYAVGSYGFLMTSAYVALAAALVALALGLSRVLATPARSAPGIVLLLIAAAALLVAGAFPVDVGSARPVTSTGWAHRLAAIAAFAGMSLGPLALARPFGRRPGWGDLGRAGTVVGVVGVSTFVAIQLVLLERGLAGVAQRFVLALVLAWLFAVSLRLLRDR